MSSSHLRVRDAPTGVIRRGRPTCAYRATVATSGPGNHPGSLASVDKNPVISTVGTQELPPIMAGKEKAMTNRELILGRIREALKNVAPPPIFREPAARSSPLPLPAQSCLPPVGETLEQQIELFRRNLEELKVE